MASRALSNILGGVMEGVAGSMRDRRLNREEEKAWQKEKERKREMLDMQDEYSQRSEERQRQQRKTDEQATYDLNKQRKNQEMLDMQEAIKNIDPERWNNDSAYKRSIMTQQLGVKVPALPTNPKIQAAMMSGDIEKGLALASSSNNPEDRQFFNDMLAMITKAKAFKQFEGNIGNVSQGALARVAGQPGSTAIPMPGKGKTGNAAPQSKQALSSIEKLLRAKQNEVKTLSSLINPATMSDAEISRLNADVARATAEMQKLQREYVTMLEAGAGMAKPKPTKQQEDEFKTLLEKINGI